jgi:hypothetical protein
LHLAGDVGVRPIADAIAVLPNAWFSKKLALWLVDNITVAGDVLVRADDGPSVYSASAAPPVMSFPQVAPAQSFHSVSYVEERVA